MMQTLTQVLLIIGAGFILWFTYQSIKRNPQVFSAENINKSIFTLGILALCLIAIIAFLVYLLKN